MTTDGGFIATVPDSLAEPVASMTDRECKHIESVNIVNSHESVIIIIKSQCSRQCSTVECSHGSGLFSSHKNATAPLL